MRYKLLIVEDDKQIREILTDYFEDDRKEDSFVITTAKDGLEAVDFLDTKEFDLVFLDVMLPGLNGFQICKRIPNHYSAYRK